MLDRTIVLGTIAASMLAMPVAAQAPAPTTTAFDGTYAFVSSTPAPPVNALCGNDIGGPLVAAQGRAEFTNLLGRHSHFEGTIGSQGELMLRATAIHHGDTGDIVASGRIDRDGTVRVRMTGNVCSFDVVWQKEHR
jgi:hypothetical protein